MGISLYIQIIEGLCPLDPQGSEGAAFMKGQIKMKKYYIIREDGTSIFQLPYPKDFCIHCLCLLIEDGQRYRLLSSTQLEHLSLFACDGSKLKLPV